MNSTSLNSENKQLKNKNERQSSSQVELGIDLDFQALNFKLNSTKLMVCLYFYYNHLSILDS